MFKVGDKVRVVKWEDLPLESIDWAMCKNKVEYHSLGIGKKFIDKLSSASEPFTIMHALEGGYLLNDEFGFAFKDYNLENYVTEKRGAENNIQIGDTGVYNGAEHENYPR